MVKEIIGEVVREVVELKSPKIIAEFSRINRGRQNYIDKCYNKQHLPKNYSNLLQVIQLSLKLGRLG
jgi:hypothetical protein